MPQNHTIATAIQTILFVLALLLFSNAFAQPPTAKQLKRKNYLEIYPAPRLPVAGFGDGVRVEQVDRMPMYPDGLQGIVNFIAYKTRYTLSGKTTLKFSIDTDGSAKDVTIIQTDNETIGKEMARILEKTDNWQPAIIDGKPAMLTIQIPLIWKTQ